MWFRLLSLSLLLYCCHLVASSTIEVNGKKYRVKPYEMDCRKYMICSDGKCKLESCDPTYFFNPVTSTCTRNFLFSACRRLKNQF